MIMHQPESARPFTRASRSHRPLAFVLLICCALLLWPTGAPAQSVQHTENKPDQALKGDFRVDPSTLGMSVTIPLGSYPGRGGVNLPLSLTYSSKVWRVDFLRTWLSQGTHTPFNELSPKYAENSVSGWTSSLDIPLIEFTGRGQYYDNTGAGECDDCDPTMQTGADLYIKRIHVHLPDGSSHELRASDDPQSAYPVNFSGVYRSVDASRLIYDTATHTLSLPDGSRYLFASNEISLRGRLGLPATTYIDRHGNTLSYNATNGQWTDTLGRVISNPLPAEAPASAGMTTYEVARVGSASPMSYTFHWERLADALAPNQTLKYTGDRQCNRVYNPPAVSPALFTNTASASEYVCAKMNAGLTAPELFNPVVLSEIELPTGQSYTFTYNLYGEIERVTLPTGGYEEYAYGAIPPLSYQTNAYAQANRGVTKRWVSVDGSSNKTLQGQYSATTTSGVYTVRATAYDNTYTERVLIAGNLYGNIPSPFGIDDPNTGKVKEERVFNAAGQMLRRSLTQWALLPVKTVEIVLDTGGNALTSTIEMHYDADLNVDWTKKYDYASVASSTAETVAITSIANGALVRTDETTYLVSDTSISSTVRQSYRDRNLTALPSSSRVRNAAGTIVSQSEIKYDEAAYPLLTYGTVTGWIDPATSVRGLPTTTRSWLDTSNSWIEAHAQYDQTGNVRKAWDGKGNQSEVQYASTYHYAYPTLTKSAIPDPTNVRATNTALVSTSVYDFSTGRVTSTKDANGQASGLATSYEYGDAMGRLTKLNSPDGGWTEYFYNETVGNLYVRTLTAMNATQSVESRQYFDGLGRPARAFLYDGTASTPWSVTDTYYDTMGRAAKVSNPYRVATAGATVPATCAACTTNAYDALGRVSTVTTPDGAQVTSAYKGNEVTVTDQAGKQRKSVTDGLGRLTTIYEDPHAPGYTGLNYQTSYTYDVLGNLRKVDQGGQFRYFMYDSLGRLIRAKNPEQLDNANLATAADPVSGNTQWSLSYAYDNNGNLTSKTDARGVTAIYEYDQINRNINIDYSDTTTVNPDIMRYYDGAVGGRGRFWYNYKVGSNTWEHTAVDGYDSMGRVYQQRQVFHTNGVWSPFYYVTRSYDRMGHVTAQTYPSGHVVNYSQFDAAGRLKQFTGNLGDNTSRTYTSGLEYDEAGRMKMEQFGTQTALYHKRRYNVRGQMWDVRLSTVGDVENWNRGAIQTWYTAQNQTNGASGTDNNGNVRMARTFIPNDDALSSFSYLEQRYNYDQLNRLKYVEEYLNGQGSATRQEYDYDRWGNRQINAVGTSNTLNEKQFAIDTGTNRVGVPAGQLGVMEYDAAGNLTDDSYTGVGARSYDGENRMTSAVIGLNSTSVYSYDADGRRVRRQTPNETVWQVYGIDGELLAEYASGAAPASPQKEYGYRHRELLITAESNSQINWLVADHLGTPRLIADPTGSLAGIKRHDYLPFGEEIGAGVGGRTTAQGYSGNDGVRQGFTGYEEDAETGLDYAQARYYSNAQGRFTSVDPENAGANAVDPQSWNGYSYVSNNPLRFVDPNGLALTCRKDGKLVSCEYALNQIRQGNFESLTYSNSNGVSLTVRRADFYTSTRSTRAEGTEVVEVVTTIFNDAGFRQAAGNLAGFLQQSVDRSTAGASRGFGGGRDFSGSGSGVECPSCPAFNDDPYNRDVVNGRLNRPSYISNPAHNSRSSSYNPRKTPEPTDAATVYQSSVRVGMGKWYGKNSRGEYYQYYSTGDGTAHFAGTVPKSKVPKDVLNQLGR
jgi:RHS repeat-associated protein